MHEVLVIHGDALGHVTAERKETAELTWQRNGRETLARLGWIQKVNEGRVEGGYRGAEEGNDGGEGMELSGKRMWASEGCTEKRSR